MVVIGVVKGSCLDSEIQGGLKLNGRNKVDKLIGAKHILWLGEPAGFLQRLYSSGQETRELRR